MYASGPGEDSGECDVCCYCGSRKPPAEKEQVRSPSRVNWGVVVGCSLLVMGVLAVLVGFLMPQKAYDKLRRTGPLTEAKEHELRKFSLWVDILVIAGLAVLSVGGVVVSIALLLPLTRRKRHHHIYRHQDEPIDFFASEVYVKEDTNDSKQSPSKDGKKGALTLGFLKDFEPGDIVVRNVQPPGNTEPKSNVTSRHGLGEDE